MQMISDEEQELLLRISRYSPFKEKADLEITSLMSDPTLSWKMLKEFHSLLKSDITYDCARDKFREMPPRFRRRFINTILKVYFPKDVLQHYHL